MSVTPTVLLLSIGIGLPLLLLAAGVVYHAHVLGRQQPAAGRDALADHVQSLATESTDELLAHLELMIEQVQGQLVTQRRSLERLLTEQHAPTALRAEPSAYERVAAGQFMPQQFPAHTTPMMEPAPGDLRGQIRLLAAEGNSDRAIARRLGIGLEEVRIARMRGMRS
jgi:hypothetical protein